MFEIQSEIQQETTKRFQLNTVLTMSEHAIMVR